MERQAQAPQNRPDVVLVDVVGQLVGQDVSPDRPVFRRLGGQVDGGPEQAEEAGGGQAVRRVERQGAVGLLQELTALFQPPGKAEVGPEHGQRHQNRGCRPQSKDNLPGRPEVSIDPDHSRLLIQLRKAKVVRRGDSAV